MIEIVESPVIAGVKLVKLRPFGDERGSFIEMFRKEWFPERSWERVQTNRSESAAGVLRGLHYHKHQVDYWHVIRGRVQVGLADLRRSSPTFRAAYLLTMAASDHLGLFIPCGVAHGFLALEETTLSYVVDNYYDGSDELGVAWNDPAFGLEWASSEPVISKRDQNNRRLDQIDPADLPQ
jgi:dTDP-4-dehydrorhamnose 3,5-epimerase